MKTNIKIALGVFALSALLRQFHDIPFIAGACAGLGLLLVMLSFLPEERLTALKARKRAIFGRR